MKLKRKPEFYFSMFVVPAAVIFLILPAIHLFPPGASEKTTLGESTYLR